MVIKLVDNTHTGKHTPLRQRVIFYLLFSLFALLRRLRRLRLCVAPEELHLLFNKCCLHGFSKKCKNFLTYTDLELFWTLALSFAKRRKSIILRHLCWYSTVIFNIFFFFEKHSAAKTSATANEHFFDPFCLLFCALTLKCPSNPLVFFVCSKLRADRQHPKFFSCVSDKFLCPPPRPPPQTLDSHRAVASQALEDDWQLCNGVWDKLSSREETNRLIAADI